MLSMLDALAHISKVVVDPTQALALSRGQRLDWASLGPGADPFGPVCAIRQDEAGPAIVAMIARDSDGTVKILRGFRG